MRIENDRRATLLSQRANFLGAVARHDRDMVDARQNQLVDDVFEDRFAIRPGQQHFMLSGRGHPARHARRQHNRADRTLHFADRVGAANRSNRDAGNARRTQDHARDQVRAQAQITTGRRSIQQRDHPRTLRDAAQTKFVIAQQPAQPREQAPDCRGKSRSARSSLRDYRRADRRAADPIPPVTPSE